MSPANFLICGCFSLHLPQRHSAVVLQTTRHASPLDDAALAVLIIKCTVLTCCLSPALNSRRFPLNGIALAANNFL